MTKNSEQISNVPDPRPITRYAVAAEALKRVPIEAPAEIREVTYRGVTFSVVWDGSIR